MNTLTKLGIFAAAAWVVSKYAAGSVTNRLGISFSKIVLDKKADVSDFLTGLPGSLVLNVNNQNDFDISILNVNAWVYYGQDRIIDLSTSQPSVLKQSSNSSQLIFGFRIPFSETLRFITRMFENSCFYRLAAVRGNITVRMLGTTMTIPLDLPLTCQ